MDEAVIILAAGEGKRMKSAIPKPLIELHGIPMLEYIMQACKDYPTTVVISPKFRDYLLNKYANN